MYSPSRILPAGRRAVRRRMPKSISVYTVLQLHSSDGLRDERKRNALTLSSIQLAPMYKWWPSRRLWPWLAANNCQLQGQLLQCSWSSKQTGRSFPLCTSPSPWNPRPSPLSLPPKNFRQPQSFSCNLGPKCTSLQTNTSPSQSLIYAMPTDQISAQDMSIEVGKCGLKV